jgi:SAM-dependent methyltransferase
MRLLHALIARPLTYRIWQAPFADRKIQPILAHNDLARVRRVLDVACGPGTNTKYFRGVEYLGVDWNEDYIRHAIYRYGQHFICADVTDPDFAVAGTFDFILVNSVLHHLSDAEIGILLQRLAPLLAREGSIHMLELVLPPAPGVAGLLARLDRGRYARPLAEWHRLLAKVFVPEHFEPYVLTGFGVPLWHMVYFKGRLAR